MFEVSEVHEYCFLSNGYIGIYFDFLLSTLNMTGIFMHASTTSSARPKISAQQQKSMDPDQHIIMVLLTWDSTALQIWLLESTIGLGCQNESFFYKKCWRSEFIHFLTIAMHFRDARSMGGGRRDITRGTKVLLQWRKQRLRPSSERTPGEWSTLPEVNFCQRSGFLGLEHSSPPLEKPL